MCRRVAYCCGAAQNGSTVRRLAQPTGWPDEDHSSHLVFIVQDVEQPRYPRLERFLWA
jgi:hypothetical protein